MLLKLYLNLKIMRLLRNWEDEILLDKIKLSVSFAFDHKIFFLIFH